jgi:hypothetical protein
LLELTLEGEGGGYGVGGAGEDGEEAVALPALLDERAGVVGDEGGSERIVAGESRLHRPRVLLPELGAALDVGEQERDGF